MTDYLYNQKLYLKNQPSRLKQILSTVNPKNLATAAVISLAALGTYKGVDVLENLVVKAYNIIRAMTPTYEVPERYCGFYKKLEQMEVPYEKRKMIAASCFTETKHRQFIKRGKRLICKINKDGDLGVSQILRNSTKEVRRRNLVYDDLPEYEDVHQQSISLTSPYERQKISSLRKKMANDPITNIKFGAALLLYYDRDVTRWCEKYNVRYDSRITIAVNNYGPRRMEEALLRHGNDWYFNIPKEVQEHVDRYTKFYRANIKGI